MRMTLYHLTGSLRGKTQQLDADAVMFGTGEGCGVRFDAALDAAVSPRHADLAIEQGVQIIRDQTGKRQLFVNGLRQAEAALRDGDLVQFGESGPEVRFRLPSDGAPVTKPLKTIVADSRDIVVRTPHPHYLSAFYLIRHIVGDILLHASPIVKVAAGVALVVPLLLIIWLGGEAYRQYEAAARSQRAMAELMKQLETGRLSNVQLKERVERERQAAAESQRQRDERIAALTAKLQAQEQMRESQRGIQTVREQLSAIRQSQSFAEDIVRRFGGSIGLLQGGYGFKEKSTGRPLRYQGLDQLGNPYVDKDGNALVTLEGIAPRVLIYFAGTAFLADRAGTIVTNRHIVRMWESFGPAQQAITAGFEPEMIVLRLFFPGEDAPYLLTELALSDRAGVAILRTDRVPKTATPVTLAGDASPRIGEPVMMLSYPGSVDALLARAVPSISQDILAKAQGDPVRLVDEVAHNQLIRPLATQGHISDVSPDLITYEAASSSGSSGAPIFNRAGAVVGVNHVTLQRVEGVHMALPIRFVAELLDSRKQRTPQPQ
ncbi:MAG TPA: trypsin-like peptidase domain-containing protein [Nitrospiraceae bacterium]|nr:trypsin-like peptidase domain-containing protein [Nitrospiraceae bacterium]